MNKNNWTIKVIFSVYLIAAFVLGFFFSVKAIIRSNNETDDRVSPLISEYVTASSEQDSTEIVKETLSSGTTDAEKETTLTETIKETVKETVKETIKETIKETSSAEATKENPTKETVPEPTSKPSEPQFQPTTEAPKVTYVPYTFANGVFKDKTKSYTYKVVNADFVKLHVEADGYGDLTVVPRNATGKVISVCAYYSKIEYKGYTGYIFNKYIELH